MRKKKKKIRLDDSKREREMNVPLANEKGPIVRPLASLSPQLRSDKINTLIYRAARFLFQSNGLIFIIAQDRICRPYLLYSDSPEEGEWDSTLSFLSPSLRINWPVYSAHAIGEHKDSSRSSKDYYFEWEREREEKQEHPGKSLEPLWQLNFLRIRDTLRISTFFFRSFYLRRSKIVVCLHVRIDDGMCSGFFVGRLNSVGGLRNELIDFDFGQPPRASMSLI